MSLSETNNVSEMNNLAIKSKIVLKLIYYFQIQIK